jgi:hypothetical protein
MRHLGFILLLSAVALVPVQASAQSFGACVVRDSYTDLASYPDPDFATGYAKVNEPSSDIDTLLSICTDDVFANLMQLYCSCSLRPEPVQWEFASYNSAGLCEWSSDGTTCTTGCAASGCDFHSCEGVAVVDCTHTIPQLTFDVQRLIRVGTLDARHGRLLLRKLEAAQSFIGAGHTNAARSQLAAFVRSVQSLAHTGRLPSDWAEVLVAFATAIAADL